MDNIASIKKTRCCGCEVCADICNFNAISMKMNQEGFAYPIVDTTKCINCRRCLSVCPVMNSGINNSEPVAYAAKNIEEDVRMRSRSGGVFPALAEYILSVNGVAYGAVFDDDFSVKHVRADNFDECRPMQGSKYIQSRMHGVLNSILKDLDAGRFVLFSGTSCQVQAIRRAIPKRFHDNLFLVDIVCHGVPSPLIWQNFIQMVATQNKGKITSVNFRNKYKYGWKEHVETVEVSGVERDSRIFTNFFYNHLILRPSCYECAYKNYVHPGDITLADFWGIDTAVTGFNDDKGVSLVLVNNARGGALLSAISDKLLLVEVNKENCMQPPLKGNFVCPSARKKFWRDYSSRGIEYVCKKYGVRLDESLIDKIHRHLNKIRK